MCGIAGILNLKGEPVPKEALEKMCRKMKHRGPDDEGIYISNPKSRNRNSKLSLGLGHTRLSIIDLSISAHQPMCNEDTTIWLSMNGEIYNYVELSSDLKKKGHKFKSSSDAEVIIHLYEELGKNCVKELRGMFAFAIWDEREETLFLARDRVGKKPLVYSFKNGNLTFASELAALIESGKVDKETNKEAIHDYLSYGYIPAPLTIYEGVYKLPPGCTLTLKKDSDPIIENYWNLDFSSKIKISEEDAADELLHRLKSAVKMRLRSDVPLGAFLSGGIDSSAVVALMSELSESKIKTFSIGFDDSNYNELAHAKRVSEKYDTDHHEFVVKPKALDILPLLVERYGEPYADSSAIPTYYVSQQTKQFVTVALNGDGADELFGGYERYQAVLLSNIYKKIPALIRNNMIPGITNLFSRSLDPKNRFVRIKRFVDGTSFPLSQRYLYWSGIISDELKNVIYTNEFTERVSHSNPSRVISKYLNPSSNLKLLDSLLLADTMNYLPNDLLAKVDIASMANSLECRSPFLDHPLMEFAASLPPELKIKGLVKKYVLKKAVSKLIPKENICRKKMGFGVPIGRWLRGELKPLLRETLLSSVSLQREYFKPGVVANLVEDHIRGVKDYSSQLWALLMLELWHLKFIDKSI